MRQFKIRKKFATNPKITLLLLFSFIALVGGILGLWKYGLATFLLVLIFLKQELAWRDIYPLFHAFLLLASLIGFSIYFLLGKLKIKKAVVVNALISLFFSFFTTTFSLLHSYEESLYGFPFPYLELFYIIDFLPGYPSYFLSFSLSSFLLDLLFWFLLFFFLFSFLDKIKR
jgi:hypothetical protein